MHTRTVAIYIAVFAVGVCVCVCAPCLPMEASIFGESNISRLH